MQPDSRAKHIAVPERRLLLDSWPVVIAVLIFLLLSWIVLRDFQHRTGFSLTYALDDAYIHMAIAKNLVQHGVFGVTPYSFTASSSSPLWTLFIAAVYTVTGVRTFVPLALNLFFGLCLLVLSGILLRSNGVKRKPTFLVLLAVIFFTPLIPMLFSGMEHVLQILLSLAFVYLAAVNLERGDTRSQRALLFLIAPFVAAVRYEGLFLLAIVSLLFLLRRRLLEAVTLLGLGLLPVAVMGFVSINHGWFFLPASIVLKSTLLDNSQQISLLDFLLSGIKVIIANPYLFGLFLAAALTYFKNRALPTWHRLQVMLLIFLGTVLMQVQFARVGWFYRYDAYLIAIGVFALGLSWTKSELQTIHIPSSRYLQLSAFLVILLLIPLGKRGLDSLKETPIAMKNIYEQQYQMGLFIQDYYRGRPVAINDVGAVNFLGSGNNLDLWGLASLEVAQMKMQRTYTPAAIRELAQNKGVKIAIVYPSWVPVPDEWFRVGTWTIPNNVVCGSPTVTFYALTQEEADNLRGNLHRFSSNLPADVGKQIY
jgi:hypothetical protein